MRWLSNVYDPRLPEAKMYVSRLFCQSHEEALEQHQQWLSDKIIGEPKATDHFTVEQLKKMNMVGVYAKD